MAESVDRTVQSSSGDSRVCSTCATAYTGELCPKCVAKFAVTPLSGGTKFHEKPFGDKLGRYVLEKELGAGGSGVVWLARDPQLGRQVAIKILSGASQDDIARFDREAQTAASLQHPNIAPIFEVGRHENRPYIAMQYVDGQSLDELMHQRKPGVREAVAMIRDAARAVHYAHQRGVIHRDLKPHNIMVQTGSIKGPEGALIFVMDFGLARRTDVQSSISVTGMLLGTPSYMSPEQAKGDTDLDARTDVYGLGATLYTLVTGRPPYSGNTPLEIVLKAADGDIAPPRRLRRELHRDIETIIVMAMARERERRYRTAADLADDLQCFLDSEPIHARPASIVYTLTLRLRRHPARFAAGVACLLALATIAAFFGQRLARESEALDHLRQANEHHAAGRWPDALAHFEGYLAWRKSDPDAEAKRDACRGKIELQRRIVALDADVRQAAELVDSASGYLNEPEYDPAAVWKLIDHAAARLDRILGEVPDMPTARYHRARARRLHVEHVKAREDIDRAIELEPGNIPARIERARVIAESVIDMFIDRAPVSRERATAVHAMLAVARVDLDRLSGVDRSTLSPRQNRDLAVVLALQDLFGDGGNVFQSTKALRERVEKRNDAEMYMWLGALYWRTRVTKEAAEFIDKALAGRPCFPRALYVRASLATESGRQEEALRDLNEAIRLLPFHPAFWALRGHVHGMAGRRDLGIADALRAIELDPNWYDAYFVAGNIHLQADRREKALEFYDRLEKLNPRVHQVHTNRAQVYIDGREWESALREMNTAIRKCPDYDDYRAKRAQILMELGRPQEAMKDLDEAVNLNAERSVNFSNRGQLHVKLGNPDAATTDFNQAISLDRKNVEAWFWRGKVKQDWNNIDGALQDFTQAIDARDNYAPAFAARSQVYLDRREFDKAREDAERALQLRPGDLIAKLTRGICRVIAKEWKAGLEDLDAMVAKYPRNYPARFYRGQAHFHEKDYGKAIEDFQAALSISEADRGRIEALIQECRRRQNEQ